MNELTINIIIGSINLVFGLAIGLIVKFKASRSHDRGFSSGSRFVLTEKNNEIKNKEKFWDGKYKQLKKEFEKEIQRIKEIHNSEKNTLQNSVNSAIGLANWKEKRCDELYEKMVIKAADMQFNDRTKEKEQQSVLRDMESFYFNIKNKLAEAYDKPKRTNEDMKELESDRNKFLSEMSNPPRKYN